MGQKINPVSLRLHYTNRHFDTSWYSGYFYKQLLTKDLYLQYYLNNFLKLLKLPSGRYSIQHLQKKTQVFNFLCYPKSTREWRSKIFGLTSKNKKLKTNRCFFKNLLHSKSILKLHNNKFRSNKTKLKIFFTTFNQLSIHKIQKKITSFQNSALWSKLIKQSRSAGFFFFLEHTPYEKLRSYLCGFPYKINKFSTTSSKILIIKTHQSKDKFNNYSHRSQMISPTPFMNGVSGLHLLRNQQIDNSSLLFLQNLFVYKFLKSKKKNSLSNNLMVKNSEIAKLTNFEICLRKFPNFLQPYQPFNILDLKYKNYLESSLSSLYGTPFDLIPFKVKNDWQYASYLADEIVYFLEKRIPFRRLKTKLLRQLSKISSLRGVRITCSGRVGGKSKKAQRSKTECLKYGQTSLHVFSSPIDFSSKTAHTSFGSVGVKVWICYH